jgi:hypothetical protein
MNMVSMKTKQQRRLNYRTKKIDVRVWPESTVARVSAFDQGLPIVIERLKMMIVAGIEVDFGLDQPNLPMMPGQLKHQIPIDINTTQSQGLSSAVSSTEAYTTPAH